MDRPPAPLSPLVMPLSPPFSFTDNYGLGIPNFVYNVAHQQFDRILVCTETPAESIDTQLLKALAEVAPVVEIVTYE
ncbi:hypothetical protein O5623_07250 [Escherichia coli]|nr:hypothetical protein [Escherichia coli]